MAPPQTPAQTRVREGAELNPTNTWNLGHRAKCKPTAANAKNLQLHYQSINSSMSRATKDVHPV
jgi:hypothetical protein